ncbi:flagellar type III secretion system pore protein FliP [Roseospirillum parvum]|uniref:Flagellar biosynthetic protein FliP n=1 Tax=Roseospirillum parvum TaxID=83401 RepID=A0A1G8DHY0_9PROT|nr:flagellar type III secretion system pore protein FliP [Roseospirillum parvum]SDH57328.1 flagellar biosynthetic protein FliP [Roseospirillum parvum]
MRAFLSPALSPALALLAGLLVATLAEPALAQEVNIDLGGESGSTTARIVQLVLLMTVITVAPGLLVMVTSFTRIVVVFSILRHAMGTGTSPPNTVLVSLAMFMTIFIMAPTLEESWDSGIRPLVNERIDEAQAFERAAQPFHDFMMRHVRDKDLSLMLNLAELEVPESPETTPLRALIPAFMISELRRAFEIGFLLYVPFIIIDMCIASVLMSMGMMMLPPMMLSLPFKVIFFVLVDGWYLVVGSLVRSFG